MAKSWKCPRCSTVNEDSSITCTSCGLLQGSVFVRSALDQPPPAVSAPPARQGAVPEANQPPEWASPAPDATPTASNAAAASAEPATGPAPRVPIWRRIPIGGIVFLVFVFGGGISSWFFGAGRGEGGEIAKPGDLTAVDLRVGDCFDLKDPEATEVDNVVARPCTEEHEYEMFYTGSMPEGDYPPKSVIEVFMNTNCMPAFLAYVGKEYEASTLDLSWLSPTPDTWSQGDRSIQCSVYDPSVDRLTGSIKGAKR
jgi:hypothetical protein